MARRMIFITMFMIVVALVRGDEEEAKDQMEHRLCSCQTAWHHRNDPQADNTMALAWERKSSGISPIPGMEEILKRCRDDVSQFSKRASEDIKKLTASWVGQNDCLVSNNGDTVLRKSVQSRGDPRRLNEFHHKLDTCGQTDRPISVAVFGGSMTAGNSCKGGKGGPEATNFLGLPSRKVLSGS
mmetsp:Transcript_89766/g.179292  ORF Transcript_89766/g.179292 Transcript_89766/m.179292 type:complete len:184 (+) Transcript_89766:137-688(+)|eukprot:CAMPEP_0171689190 /NCGR_PEP_ID=MMETSP0991-20121206/4315_1 /TAXON_ID=483369 /ORGANISM="non described non described, Strain CCMP2098" /LENGTH=183 /DNA_ID=CAMNT_0012277219 /DNA_START=69 /DNA_END=620 /DNA_ORIENTATION=-